MYKAIPTWLRSALLVGLFLLWRQGFDPFDLERGVVIAGQNMLARVLGALHPGEAAALRPAARDAVVVAAIEDDQLGFGHWPWSYHAYADLIDALAAHDAAVVFLDVVITRHVDGEDPAVLIAAMRRAHDEKHLHIILAQIGAPSGEPIPCADGSSRIGGALPAAIACAAQEVVPISWASRNAPVLYPLAVERQDGAGSDPSPGLAAATAYSGGSHSDLAALAQVTDTSLFLAWGLGGAAPAAGCAQFEPAAARGTLWHLGWAARAAVDHLDPPALDHCTYLPRIAAADLLASRTGQNESDWDSVHRLVAGRAVFVGLDMMGRRDPVEPPLGPPVPGVFVHATAAENLLTLGPRGFHAFLLSPWAEWATGLLAVGAILVMERRDQIWQKLFRPQQSPPPARLAAKLRAALKPLGRWLAVALAIAAACVLLLGPALGLPLSNTLCTLILVLVFDGVVGLLQFLTHWIADHA